MEAKRAEQIADSLEQLVFKGELKDGERLDEVKLAERFQVSRTPIREALQRLVMSGIADQVPRRGVFVRQPGPVELLEMFETMAELEAACGRLAATRILNDGLARIEAANIRCQDAATRDDPAGYYRENEVFHQEIYCASANTFLQNEVLRLQHRLKPYRRVQLRLRGRLDQSYHEHCEIVEALRAGKPNAAANLLRNHVTVQGEKFQQLMANLKD